MAIPVIAAAAAKAAPLIAKAIPALKGLGSSFGGMFSGSGALGGIGNSLGNIMGGSNLLGGLLNKGADVLNNAQYDAYAKAMAGDMANQLEARAEKYDQKLQNQFNEAEPQYLQEANTQLPELQQLITDIANQSAEAQRQNQRQINASLAQQGVRGGQASILANRATGELNRNLQRDINQTAYNEAANRQNSRLTYYSDKALTPWKTMSSAYGSSMVGANNALSNAQGDVYKNAYTAALNKRGGGGLLR